MSDLEDPPDTPDADDVAAFLRGVARAPAVDPAADRALVGARLGHFVMGAPLGAGAMGVVYEARDERLGRAVAIKVMAHADDPEAQRRFLREARAASQVAHPNVATVYEVGEDDGHAYIAMELVRGATLRAWAASPRTLAERTRVAVEIASALGAAHAARVVHRDLKPENVMVTDAGATKVLDFGIAKSTAIVAPGVDGTATAEGRVLGTPAYMSPEQTAGAPVDARSDVFSLGVLLYELFTGERPFTGRGAPEVMVAIARDEPALPSKRAREVSPALERVLLRCLAKRPEGRYADGHEVARALLAAGPRRSRAPWWVWLVVIVVGIDLLAGGAAYLYRRSHVEGAAPPSPPVAAAREPAPAHEGVPTSGSTDPAALEAYRRALHTFRTAGGCGDLSAAAALDPAFAAAHLRAALCLVDSGDIGRPREPFRRALVLRDTLSDRDRALLDAFEPILGRNPSDAREAAARMRAAAERFPSDVEIAYQRAAVVDMLSSAEAEPLYRRVIELDPDYARPWYALGATAYIEGRFDEGDRAIDRCLELAPESLLCLLYRAELQAQRGQCDATEATARRMMIAAPDRFQGRQILASSRVGQGLPLSAVRELLQQGAELSDGGSLDPRATVPWSTLLAEVDTLDGDLASSLARHQAFEPSVRSLPDEDSHAWLAASEALLFTELGRDADARRVAQDFWDRYQGWEPTPGADLHAIARDLRVLLAAFLRRGGTLAKKDYDALRDAEVERWSKRARHKEDLGLVWLMVYAAPTETREEALEAVAALDRLGPPPPFLLDFPIDGLTGHVYALAGQYAEALPRLERATRACDWVAQAYAHVRAFYDLGVTRQALGDTAGACEAYGAAIARWGRGKSRSVTGDKALARSRALGCPR